MSTYLELRTELAARGFDTLSATRLGLYVNRARARLDSLHNWTYREDSATGVAPLSIPTLGQIEAVSNETSSYPIDLVGYGDLVGWGCNLADVGQAQVCYRATPAGSPVVATWPTNGDTIGVQFWKVCADLVADADVPEAPARFHGIIVDWAQQMALRDRNQFAEAAQLQADIDRAINEMVEDLISQQEPTQIRVTGASVDW